MLQESQKTTNNANTATSNSQTPRVRLHKHREKVLLVHTSGGNKGMCM